MCIVLMNVAAVTERTSIAENVNLKITDTRVSSITKEDSSITEGDVSINGTGRLPIPRLINAHTYLAEILGEAKWCREQEGVASVEHLDRIGAFSVPALAANCVCVNGDDMCLLANKEVIVVHSPKSNAKLAPENSLVSMMLENTVTIALGTDGAASGNGSNTMEKMRMAALLKKGLGQEPAVPSAQEVLQMATVDGASALNEEIETLSVRKEADFLSALFCSAQTEDATEAIVAAWILLQDRELLTIDEEKAKEEARYLADRYKN